jgi:ABC-type Fe3+/spermidine/putrescine transport system ATPase subunit
MEIYEKPSTEFVARFVGECNFFDVGIGALHEDLIELHAPGGRRFRARRALCGADGALKEKATLAVRPEDIQAGPAAAACANRLEGIVKEKLYTGAAVRLVVEADGRRLLVDTSKNMAAGISERVVLGWNPESGAVIPKE